MTAQYFTVATLCLLLFQTIALGEKNKSPKYSAQIVPFGFYSLPYRMAEEGYQMDGMMSGKRAFLMLDTGFSFTTMDVRVAHL